MGPDGYFITMLDSGHDIVVKAEDVLHPEQVIIDLILKPAELLKLNDTVSYKSCTMEEKLQLCESIFHVLDVLIDEDGIDYHLMLDLPQKTTPPHRTITFFMSSASPLLQLPSSLTEPSDSSASPSASSPISKPTRESSTAPPLISCIFTGEKQFGPRHFTIAIFEVKPTCVVIGQDVKSQECLYFLLNQDHLHTLKLGPFDGQTAKDKITSCAIIMSSLVLVNVPLSRAPQLAIQVDSSASFQAVVASKQVKVGGGDRNIQFSAYADPDTVRLVVADGGVEYDHVLSSTTLDALGGTNYCQAVTEMRQRICEEILDRIEISSLDGNYLPLPPAACDYLAQTLLAVGSTVTADASSARRPSIHTTELGRNQELLNQPHTFMLDRASDSSLVYLQNISTPECRYVIPLHDENCQSMGYTSVTHALQAENLRHSAKCVLGSVEAKVIITWDEGLLAHISRLVVLAIQEDERRKIKYLTVGQRVNMQDQEYEVTIIEQPESLQVLAEEAATQKQYELIISGANLAILVRGKVSDLPEVKRMALTDRIINGLYILDDSLRYGIRRVAEKRGSTTLGADVMNPPTFTTPHKKSYLSRVPNHSLPLEVESSAPGKAHVVARRVFWSGLVNLF